MFKRILFFYTINNHSTERTQIMTSILKHSRFIISLLLILLFVGCSSFRTFYYKKAINFERSRADLTLEKVSISEGEIVYLRNNPSDQAETILMVHGFGADKDNWILLARSFYQTYQLIIPDLPGHGESFKSMTANYSINNQVRRLHEFLNKLGLSTVHIMGHSMGGSIVSQFTSQYPQIVKSLVLVCSGGGHGTKSEFDILREQKGENPLIVNTYEDFKEIIHWAMEKPPYIPGPVLKVMAKQKIARAEIDNKIFQEVHIDESLTPVMSAIQAPTLIIWGQKDRLIHVDRGAVIQKAIPNSKFVVLKDIGHSPILEAPKKTSELIIDFYQTNKSL